MVSYPFRFYEEQIERVSDTQIDDTDIQNWVRINDFEEITNALETSEQFRSNSGQGEVNAESYSAHGIRVDLMPDFQSQGPDYIVRATVVDRDTEGFKQASEEYLEIIESSKDVGSEFAAQIEADIRDPHYSVGQEIVTDGGEIGSKAMPIGGAPTTREKTPEYCETGKLI